MSDRILLFGLLIVLASCGRESSASPPSPVPPASSAGTTSSSADDSRLPASDAAPAATDEARLSALLDELTQAVRKYSVEKRRVPKTLDELLASGHLSQVPQPPAGKRFQISKNLQVVVVSE